MPIAFEVSGSRSDTSPGVSNFVADYETALKLFGEVREIDPFRTDEVDTYSNILYTMKKQAELSQLAQHFMGVNKDRPEVSLTIGMDTPFYHFS